MVRLMDACRRLTGETDDATNKLPIFGLLAAVPGIEEHIDKYPALKQRFISPISFERGEDEAAMIYLSACMKDKAFLVRLGERLLEFSTHAFDRNYDAAIQHQNIDTLAIAACNRMVDCDSKRLFVKAWCAYLNFQSNNGDKILTPIEANELLRGGVKNFDQSGANQDEDNG